MEISEIKQLIDLGKYPQALEAIDNLEGEERLEGLILKSRVLERKGELKEALTVAEGVLEEIRSKGDVIQVLRANLMLGSIHFTLRNIPEQTDVLREAEEIFSGIKESQADIQECQGLFTFLQGGLNHVNGNINKALELLERSLVIRQALPYKHDIVESLTEIGFLHLNFTGKNALALDLFNRSLTISEQLENQTAIAHSLNRLGCYYVSMDNYDKALPFLEKSLALYQGLDNKMWIGGLYNNISIVYREKENYDLTLNYLERALAISEEIGDRNGMIINHNNIGWLYAHKGELSTAEKHFDQSLRLNKELGNKSGEGFVLSSLGDLYSIWKGELNIGLDYYQQSLSIYKEMGSDPGVAWTFLRFAMTYILQGEPELALNKIKQSETIFTKIDLKIGIGQCSVQLGRVYKLQGKYDQAIKALEAGLALVKETIVGANIGLWMSYVLFFLILVAQDLQSLELAEDYLKQMQELKETSKNKFVHLRIQFSEAIVLKMSKRMVKKFQAQQIFQTIIEDEIIDHNITVLSMLNLCELLILETKYSDTAEDLFQEVSHLGEKLHKISQNQESSSMTIMALLLQTKLALVRGDVEGASQLLSDAKKIASDKNLVNLLAQIKAEQETVQAELDKWNELIQRKATIQERVEHARIASWLVEAKKIQETWVNPTSEIANQ
ncbi:MAG: tetratricopeptide repeat protein [Candidatus Heimdallarchaeota archaeon]|nr:MAG: tetratricopeptide repeat protein [Candidatus Heimdallarchaeota archaeon]